MIKCVAINQLSKSKNESVVVLIVKFKVFSQPDVLRTGAYPFRVVLVRCYALSSLFHAIWQHC